MVRLGFVRSMLLRAPTVGNSVVVICATVGAASLLRWLLGSAADPVPFVTYFPAIVICTLLAGWRTGTASIFLSMTVVNVLFLKRSLGVLESGNSAAMMALFVFSCGLLVAIAQTLRTTVAGLHEATNRADYLNQELIHRVRNSLTVVNSLAAMTFEAEKANFPAVFSKRMAALAGGLELLSKRGGELCDVRETVEQACQPFMHEDRIRFTGDTAALAGDICVPLILAIHELCTNAVKYGALSQACGTISLMSVQEGGVIRLVWQESGGPVVVPPQREGLGSALLGHPALGPAMLTFDPGGLRCEFRLKAAC